jgi:uncharacterized membrane protein YfcA
MTIYHLIMLGLAGGACAGALAGLIGIGGGIVVVPVVYYGLVSSGIPADEAAHVAISTSLAAIMPAALVSFYGHWRAGNSDVGFLREWGPGIAIGVMAAQFAAPHLRGSLMSGVFGALCLVFAIRFAFPQRFQPVVSQPPGGWFRHLAALGIGTSSGLAGIGGGILTNVVMTLSGLPMHKSIGRAAAAGIVVSVPATIVAAFASKAQHGTEIGSIDLAVLACIAPAQALGAWVGASLAQRVSGERLSQVLAVALLATGCTMLRSSIA